MDVSEIVSELDDHGFADTSSTRKVAEINDAYWDVASREPWPWLQTSATFAFTSAGVFTALPANVRVLAMVDAVTGWPLRRVTLEERTRRFTISTAGSPRYYFQIGSTWSAFPIPSSSRNVAVTYVQNPSELSAGSVESAILIPPEHHRVLISGALSRLYAMEDDPELASAFNAEFEARIARMMRQYLLHPDELPVTPPQGAQEGGQ